MTLRMESHDSTNDSKVILFFRKNTRNTGCFKEDKIIETLNLPVFHTRKRVETGEME